MNMRKFAIAVGLVAAAGAAALACSGDDDDNVTTTGNDAGTGDAGSAFTHAGIKAFVGDVITDQFANDEVITYFAPNANDTAASGATVNDIEECLTYQLGALVGDGDTFSASSPPVVANGGVKGTGYTCRTDMAMVHAPLFISGVVFDKFVADFIAEATAKGVQLPDTALMQIAGLRPTISSSNACVPDAGNTYSTVIADCVDSGTTGDDDDAATGTDSGIQDAATGG